jgi:hypothetical protein
MDGTCVGSVAMTSRDGTTTDHRRDPAQSYRVRSGSTSTGLVHTEPASAVAGEVA